MKDYGWTSEKKEDQGTANQLSQKTHIGKELVFLKNQYVFLLTDCFSMSNVLRSVSEIEKNLLMSVPKIIHHKSYGQYSVILNL